MMMKLLHGEKKEEKPTSAAAKEDPKKGKSGQKQKQNFSKPKPKPTTEATEIPAKDVEPANDEVDMLDALVCKLQ